MRLPHQWRLECSSLVSRENWLAWEGRCMINYLNGYRLWHLGGWDPLGKLCNTALIKPFSFILYGTICYRQDGNPLSRMSHVWWATHNAQVGCLWDEQESERETPRSVRLRWCTPQAFRSESKPVRFNRRLYLESPIEIQGLLIVPYKLGTISSYTMETIVRALRGAQDNNSNLTKGHRTIAAARQ